MAAYNKFNNFVKDLAEKKHDLNADQLNVYLSNATPSATLDFVKADLAEIGAGNGYVADGIDTQNTGAVSVGVYTVTGTMCVWTAAGGTIGPFQYVVLMNVTQASPLKPLISWWDYASALTLQVGETFSVKFNGSVTTGTIFTIT
jgi:hypothetical protein